MDWMAEGHEAAQLQELAQKAQAERAQQQRQQQQNQQQQHPQPTVTPPMDVDDTVMDELLAGFQSAFHPGSKAEVDPAKRAALKQKLQGALGDWTKRQRR